MAKCGACGKDGSSGSGAGGKSPFARYGGGGDSTHGYARAGKFMAALYPSDIASPVYTGRRGYGHQRAARVTRTGYGQRDVQEMYSLNSPLAGFKARLDLVSPDRAGKMPNEVDGFYKDGRVPRPCPMILGPRPKSYFEELQEKFGVRL